MDTWIKGLKDAGLKISDYNDYHLNYSQKARIDERVKWFREGVLNDLLESFKALDHAGLKYDKVLFYVQAKHIPERTARMQKKEWSI